jgi:hypothetical protein
MTRACGRFFLDFSDENRSVINAAGFLIRPERAVGGQSRNRSIVEVRCKRSLAEPLRDGDAKLPALTAFEQRVAGLPISDALVDHSSTGMVPILRNRSPVDAACLSWRL